MIELKILRNDTERVIAGLKKRNLSPEQLDLIQEIISLDDQRKLSQANMDQRLSQINQLSKEIGLAMKSNDSVSAEKNNLEVSRLKEENKEAGKCVYDYITIDTATSLEDIASDHIWTKENKNYQKMI